MLSVSSFKLKKPQVEFIGSCDQFVSYVGGIGTGKSLSLISKALFHSQETPGNLGVIVRKNFTDLRNSTIRDFETYTGVKVNESTHEAKLPNGSSILFIHGDVLDSLKNINCGFFGIEQAEEFPDSTTWDFLVMRLRRQCKFRSGFLIANANGHNWVYKKFIAEKRPNHSCIQAKTHDFADILPPDYIKNLETTLPERLYRRYVLNSHEVTEGLVYDEYSEDRNLEDDIIVPDTWEKGFVLDHGFRNPTAVLWYAIDHDGNIWLYDEHYERERPVSHHARCILERGLDSGICDPSVLNQTQSKGSQILSIADEYREYGVTLTPALREEEYARIARVNEFFRSGRIKVCRKMRHFREEIAAWKWREVKPSQANLNLPEVPEDRDNHLCLSGDTEVITRSGNSRLEDLDGKAFDVWTPFGWRGAVCLQTGVRPTQTLDIVGGSEITGTEEHPLLTLNGWCTIGHLKQGDALYGPEDYHGYNPRVSRQTLLLGRFSVLPKGRKQKAHDVTTPSGMGSSQWSDREQVNSCTSFERGQEGQQIGEFGVAYGIEAYEPSYEYTREARTIKKRRQDSRALRPEMAPLKRGDSLALITRERSTEELGNERHGVPSLRDCIQVEVLQKERNLLLSELSHEGLPQKRVVRKRQAKSQSVYSLEVEGKAFYLSNGAVSHNCDDLGYLVASRFPAVTNPEPKVERKSFSWWSKLAKNSGMNIKNPEFFDGR